MTTDTTIADRRDEDIASEERWNAWVTGGLEYDRQLRKRGVVGAVAIAVVVALALLFLR